MNIQGKDRHHEWHCHPGYQVSGVYYMRVSPDQGGIQFLNPNNICLLYTSPSPRDQA